MKAASSTTRTRAMSGHLLKSTSGELVEGCGVELGVLGAGLADQHDAGLGVDADGAATVAAGGGGVDANAGGGELGLDGGLVAGADFHRPTDRGEHARSADEDGFEHRAARTE